MSGSTAQRRRTAEAMALLREHATPTARPQPRPSRSRPCARRDGRDYRVCGLPFASPAFPQPSGREAPGAIVWRGIVDRRSLRDDAQGIEPRDRPIIDDVIARLYGLGDARHLVELAHVVCEIGVVGDPFLVASNQRGRAATRRRETPEPLFPPQFRGYFLFVTVPEN